MNAAYFSEILKELMIPANDSRGQYYEPSQAIQCKW